MKCDQAVILAGGKGTRLHPLTLTRPNCLLKVANKTLLERQLENLEGIVKKVILVVGYRKEDVERFVEEKGFFLDIETVEQKKQLGTGDALLQVEGKTEGEFLVLMGDNIYGRRDLKKITGKGIGVERVEHPEKYGVCVTEKEKLKKIVEKPEKAQSSLVNIGLYRLDEEIFSILRNLEKSERGEYELTDAVNKYAGKRDLEVFRCREWISIGYPWDILEANRYFLGEIEREVYGEVEEGATLKDSVTVGEGTVIKSGAYIEGPVMIGGNCSIGPNCYIREGTSVGNGCRIGNAVEIKNSVIGNSTNVCHLSYIGDSILGEKVNIGAGTVVANLRTDGKNVKTKVRGKLVDTGRRKLGTIIGDGVKTGINTSIYPGRKIWPGKTTLPGEEVKKDVK